MQLTIAAPDELTRVSPDPFSGAVTLQLSTTGRWQKVVLPNARMTEKNDGDARLCPGCEAVAASLDTVTTKSVENCSLNGAVAVVSEPDSWFNRAHEIAPGNIRRPALHPRQTPQPFYLVHLHDFDVGHCPRGDGIDRGVIRNERF